MEEAFRRLLAEALGAENAEKALEGLSRDASVSLRLNPSRLPLSGEPFSGLSSAVPWSPWGRLLSSRPVFTLDPLLHGGAYYVQDSSAMFVGEMFRRALETIEMPSGRPLRVLDLCAAPGGKTTDLAASLSERIGGNYLLVANEVMRNRASVLAANVAAWGDPCVAVSSLDPSAFSRLPGFFDIIVADVPCSGEGMFRKDAEALAQWSESNVELCASRQRRIVADVWPALRSGGVFIYSTCTFNRLENDGNAGWICRDMSASPLCGKFDYKGLIYTEYGVSLVPGFVPGEGQYCAMMRKDGTEEDVRTRKNSASGKNSDRLSAAERVSTLFDIPVSVRTKGELLTVLPSQLVQSVAAFESVLPLISAGCAVGCLKGKDLVPDGDLAFCTALSGEAFNEVQVDRTTALAYLHKDNIVLTDAPRGLLLLVYDGVRLGFVKNLGNRCNNLLPQSRRIRMEIK